MNCLYCNTELIVDPVRGHWLHCPACNPEWAAHIEDVNAFHAFLSLRAYGSDTRGAPRRPGPVGAGKA